MTSSLMGVLVSVIVTRIWKNWVNPYKGKLQSTHIPALRLQLLKLFQAIHQVLKIPITTSSVSGGIIVHECNASGSGVISSNNSSHPGCSTSVSFSFVAAYQNKNPGFETLKEIFPQVPDRKIYEVFSDSQDIESAIAKLCEDANAGSCDLLQSYASVIDVIDSYDVEDFENDISLSNDGSGSLKSVENEKYTMENQEDICTKLGELFQKCSTSGNKIRLKVRRSCLWEDTLAKMKRVNPDSLNGIVTVQFIGEPAVDEGGPRKELFFLVHKHMQQLSSLFTQSYFFGPF